MTIAVVTAWQNHPELAADYFAAIEPANPDQLVIVDDGSDVPIEFAALRLDEPAGFCGANNRGLELVETEYVVFVNNDVAPLRESWLDEIRVLVEPGVIVGPLRFDVNWQHRYAGEDVAHPYADGWCLAMLTEDARKLGGWDEAYDVAGPAYFSDNALCFRARMAGMRLREVRPGLKHKGGKTGGVDEMRFNTAMEVNGRLYAEQVREALVAA